MTSVVSTHKKIKNDRRKWKCQLTFLFRRLFLTSLCYCVYGYKGMGHAGEVWVFDRSVLCSWECLHVKRGRGKTVREFQFQFQTVTLLFQFRRDRREGVVLRKLLTCRLKETTPFGDHFPPKSPTRHRFGNLYFPLKAHTTPFGGPTFPPNFPRWIGLLSFFFGFFLILVWFKWIGLF